MTITYNYPTTRLKPSHDKLLLCTLMPNAEY